jgi:hypothetical protein
MRRERIDNNKKPATFAAFANRATVRRACAQLKLGTPALRGAVANLIQRAYPRDFNSTNAAYAALYGEPMRTTQVAPTLEPRDASLVPAILSLLNASDALAKTNPEELVSFLKDLYTPAFDQDRTGTRATIEHLMKKHRGLLHHTLKDVWEHFSLMDLLQKYIEQ